MENLDTETIGKIIRETSGSGGYTNRALRLDRENTEAIELLKTRQKQLDDGMRRAAAAKVARRTAELEAKRRLDRVCVVIDFDMFYAACEIRDRPELAEYPVAIGGAHSVILTANYVARRWGVRSAMPGFVALALCKRGPEFGQPSVDLILLPADYSKYTAAAAAARDADGMHRLAEDVVHEIRGRVKEATGGLTTSAGIATNFMLAKIGADFNKPDGQYRVGASRDEILAFMGALPARKVPGIGKTWEKRLAALGVTSCGDLLKEAAELHCLLTPVRSEGLLRKALGISEGGVEGAPADHSVSMSDTFSTGCDDPDALRKQCRRMCDGLGKRMVEARVRGTTLTLTLKTSDWDVRSRTGAPGRLIGSPDDLAARALPMLERELQVGGDPTRPGRGAPLKLRLIGVKMTRLQSDDAPAAPDGTRRLTDMWAKVWERREQARGGGGSDGDGGGSDSDGEGWGEDDDTSYDTDASAVTAAAPTVVRWRRSRRRRRSAPSHTTRWRAERARTGGVRAAMRNTMRWCAPSGRATAAPPPDAAARAAAARGREAGGALRARERGGARRGDAGRAAAGDRDGSARRRRGRGGAPPAAGRSRHSRPPQAVSPKAPSGRATAAAARPTAAGSRRSPRSSRRGGERWPAPPPAAADVAAIVAMGFSEAAARAALAATNNDTAAVGALLGA